MIEPVTGRTILHVDLDAFFAAVEQRDRPELRGKPVVVGGGGPNQRGVVSAASYEARTFGIHSAMPLREAGRRCPDAIFLPVDGRKYLHVSREVMAILRRYTPLVEPISIDEAFLDVTGSRELFGDGPTIARAIKDTVREEVQLTISVGVATTKLVAKIASDLEKPDGLVVVPPGEEAAFMAPLDIGRLWGVGEKTATALREYGVRTMGDLAALPVDLLERRFGKHGSTLADRARGVDADRVVGEGEAAKSVGHEHTFDVDTSDREMIERTLLAMADGVSGRLRASGVRAVHGDRQDPRLVVPDDHPPADAPRADRPDRADLPGGAGAGQAGGPRLADPAARGERLSPRRAGAARALPVRRPAPAERDRGGGSAAEPLWRAGRDARAVAGDRPAGSVRAGSAVVVRATGRAWRRRRGGAVTCWFASARWTGGS